MGTVTTTTCDRCKEVIPTDDQVWEVGALAVCKKPSGNAIQVNFRGSMYQIKEPFKMEVCRSCLIHLGFVTGDKEIPDPPETPSLEDILREVIAEEVQSAVEGGY